MNEIVTLDKINTFCHELASCTNSKIDKRLCAYVELLTNNISYDVYNDGELAMRTKSLQDAVEFYNSI